MIGKNSTTITWPPKVTSTTLLCKSQYTTEDTPTYDGRNSFLSRTFHRNSAQALPALSRIPSRLGVFEAFQFAN